MTSDRHGTNRLTRTAVLTPFVAAVLTFAGCEDELPPGTVRESVELTALPKPVLDAAKKTLPGVTFSDAWKNLEPKTKNLHSFEVRGRQESSGKIREVRISPSGEILETE